MTPPVGGSPFEGGLPVRPISRLVAFRRRIFRWFSDRPAAKGRALIAPGVGFLLLFFLIPLLLVVGYSVMRQGAFGKVEVDVTFEHFIRFGDPLYVGILVRTLAYSAVATVACLVLGFPVAWLIARSGRWRNFLMFLVILPFWSSFLVRTFSMIFMMRDSGLVNSLLLKLGLIAEPLQLLYTPFAVVCGLVYGFLPFMILPIYASLEKLDPSVLEAAEVLGARPAARFFKVVLPLAAPGVAAGSLLVFIPSLGSFLTSDLLGGAKEMMIGNLVQNQFMSARNWPFGSASSLILMGVVLFAVLFWLRAREPGGRL